MSYKTELIRSMQYLSENNKVLFLGQSVKFSGNAIFNTLEEVNSNKKIELPVFEDTQMGISTGLALSGYIPVTCISDYDLPGYARTHSTHSATNDPNGDEHENYSCKCAHNILPRNHVESNWYRYEVIGDHEDLHYHT